MSTSLKLGLALCVGGVLIFWFGWQEKGLADAASQEPETIALKKLIERGPEGNPNIILTDFELCQNIVYITKGGERWTEVWCPIVPANNSLLALFRAPPPAEVRAIIFSTNAGDENELGQRCDVPQLRGLITNKIKSLGRKEKELLQKNYPGTDFDKCLIIQEGREPASAAKLWGLLGGGGGLALVGLALLGMNLNTWLNRRASKETV